MSTTLNNITLDNLAYNNEGLIPAIAQDNNTGRVLMMAWMNKEAVKLTLEDGYAWYWSRSRQKLWKKGESSGQLQQVKKFYLDCDLDTILLAVEQTGVACHTGRISCFFNEISLDKTGALFVQETEPPLIDPATLYGND